MPTEAVHPSCDTRNTNKIVNQTSAFVFGLYSKFPENIFLLA
jgi:hypothetical protein